MAAVTELDTNYLTITTLYQSPNHHTLTPVLTSLSLTICLTAMTIGIILIAALPDNGVSLRYSDLSMQIRVKSIKSKITFGIMQTFGIM